MPSGKVRSFEWEIVNMFLKNVALSSAESISHIGFLWPS